MRQEPRADLRGRPGRAAAKSPRSPDVQVPHLPLTLGDRLLRLGSLCFLIRQTGMITSPVPCRSCRGHAELCTRSTWNVASCAQCRKSASTMTATVVIVTMSNPALGSTACVCTHTHTYTQTRTLQTHAHSHRHTVTHTHLHTHIVTHPHTQTHSHTPTQTHIHTDTHKHTVTQSHAHAYTHI